MHFRILYLTMLAIPISSAQVASEPSAKKPSHFDAFSSTHSENTCPPSYSDDCLSQNRETIVVSASRKAESQRDAVSAIQVISKREVVASGSSNLSELLTYFPGVQIVEGMRGKVLRMQGLDAKYVLVMVNGRKTIGRVAGAIDLERISLLQVERIEILQGASSALYGTDALAGVINIITSQPDKIIRAEATLRSDWALEASTRKSYIQPNSDIQAFYETHPILNSPKTQSDNCCCSFEKLHETYQTVGASKKPSLKSRTTTHLYPLILNPGKSRATI